MEKTPISVALERQIPEFIRGEYELFVNFIKAYYEFLNETQQRNLEDIRSIENTLEQFIVRFKKELSALFPTNTLKNERFILQKIRQFYQSRGSKESFQFLFRILFNKDSEIFYPSTQMLKASDGKWTQEKSIFVRSSSGELFNLSEKIIKIETDKKEIYVFCPRVVYYRENIYEVFIDRSYVQDIEVGNIVSSEDGSYYGEIIECPNKYTIVSKGASFEAGQLYYLKTTDGDGSLIKITKIGTGGSIEKIQVISFGLDYKSTFYAKLSNKQAVALPYYSPVTALIAGTPTYSGNTSYGVLTTLTGTVTQGSNSVALNAQAPFAFTNLSVVKTSGTGNFVNATQQVVHNAGNFVIGNEYTIVTAGTTDFTSIGAENNNIGTVFTATGIGTGNGTASTLITVKSVSASTTTPLSDNTLLLSKPAETSGTITFKVLSNSPAYSDGTNGFVDYGYINRQDYFYFDKFYTPSIANDQNVFYVDGSYVGEIIGSFYTNASNTNVIDEDAAEIKVELGAVAIYPGYYSSSDGFISDESYIQDGKYYQLFSYVIRVEQQIDSYYDIVKQLLHPAGLELFAEYNIKNDYYVSATPLLAFIRLQFFEQNYITDDQGTRSINKNIVSSDAVSTAVHNYLNDIKDIQLSIQKYKPDGTLAGETDQNRWSTVDPMTANRYDDEKNIDSSDSLYSASDERYNDVIQRSADLTNVLTDSIDTKVVDASKADSSIADSESAIRSWDISSIENGTFYQTTSASHLSSSDIKDVTKTGIQSTSTQNDSIKDDFDKNTTSDTAPSVDEITRKEVEQAKTDDATANSESAVRSWDISSIENGTFYQTTTASHLSSSDIKDVTKPGIQSTSSQTDSFDRTVTYDRSTVPLVSLDPALATDSSAKAITPRTIDDLASAVGGEWQWNGVSYVLINPEIRIGAAYFRTPDDSISSINTSGTLYYNAYNQNDALDPLTSYSYDSETYAERITVAIS